MNVVKIQSKMHIHPKICSLMNCHVYAIMHTMHFHLSQFCSLLFYRHCHPLRSITQHRDCPESWVLLALRKHRWFRLDAQVWMPYYFWFYARHLFNLISLCSVGSSNQGWLPWAVYRSLLWVHRQNQSGLEDSRHLVQTHHPMPSTPQLGVLSYKSILTWLLVDP